MVALVQAKYSHGSCNGKGNEAWLGVGRVPPVRNEARSEVEEAAPRPHQLRCFPPRFPAAAPLAPYHDHKRSKGDFLLFLLYFLTLLSGSGHLIGTILTRL